MNVSINLHDFTATAAKAPSDKAIKKAQEVLKRKNDVKVATLLKVVEKPISQLVELKKTRDGRMDDIHDQIDKKKAEIESLTEQADKVWGASLPKVDKLAARAVKAIDAVIAAGGKYNPPAIITGYIDAARAGINQVDAAELPAKKKKKVLGKGIKDLKGDGGKTKKSVKQMTSESSSHREVIVVEEPAADVRDMIIDSMDEFSMDRKKFDRTKLGGQPNTVNWERKNAYTPKGRYSTEARKHFQQLTFFGHGAKDKKEIFDEIHGLIDEAGAEDNIAMLSNGLAVELKSPDGTNVLYFNDGTAGWTLSHDFKKH